MKKSFCAIFTSLLFISSAFAFDMPFLSGYAGILGNINNSELSSVMLVDGQLDFAGKFLLRGGLYIEADDMFNREIFSNASDTNSYFTLEEVSGTYVFNLGNTANYATAFIGNFEPIGSDVFLRRQFGIKSISSNLTESFHGLNGSAIYKMNGIGGAYTIKINQNMAAAAYIYSTEDNDIKYINTDLRYAGFFNNIILDTSLGLGFPIETKDDNDNDVIVLIRTLTMHGGATLLIGNSYDNSVFIQAGVKTLIFDPNSEESLGIANDISNFYLFVEPRIVNPSAQIHFSVFLLPTTNMEDMMYLSIIPKKYTDEEFTVGYNMALLSNQIYLNSTDINLGLNYTNTLTDPSIEDLISDFSSILDWKLDMMITPFASMNIKGGNITASLIISFLDLSKGTSQAITGNLGFKTQF